MKNIFLAIILATVVFYAGCNTAAPGSPQSATPPPGLTPLTATITPTYDPLATPTNTPQPPKPDLVINAMMITLNTTCLGPGSLLGLVVAVKNTGNAAASSVVVDLNGSTRLASANINPGQTVPVWFDTYNSGTANTASADPYDTVVESDETNNTSSQILPEPTAPAACPSESPTITSTPTLFIPPTITNTTILTNTPTCACTGTPGASETITATVTVTATEVSTGSYPPFNFDLSDEGFVRVNCPMPAADGGTALGFDGATGHNAAGSLKLSVNLYDQIMTSTFFAEAGRFFTGSPVNLAGKTVALYVYVPADLAAVGNKFMLKMMTDNGVTCSLAAAETYAPTVAGWNYYTFTPSVNNPGNTVYIGFRLSMTMPPSSGTPWAGDIWLDEITWF